MCTAVTYKTKDFYFGRTLDYEFSYNEEITIMPRNYQLNFRNGKIINRANEGIYTEFSTNDFKQEIYQMKQEMLEKLWEAQHKEEQVYSHGSESEQAQAEQTGEQLVEKVVERSEEIEIRADEIIEANREINQAERDFEQQQQSQQDMGMNIGE